MKIDSILQGHQALLFMERYVDEGAKTYSPFAGKSEVAAEYQPRSDRPSFELITIIAPQSEVSVFQADPTASLSEFYMRAEGVHFLVHPAVWSSPGVDHLEELHALPRGQSIEVAP